MLRLSVEDILSRIQQQQPFHAVAEDYSFTLKIDSYAPYVCAAVHDGHQFRPSLWKYCLHSEYERWYEEDPATREMVAGHPIVLAGRDSRFEYDLNREPEKAIYEDAWGKQLWKEPLPQEEKAASLEKHKNFYKVAEALVEQLEALHGKVLVFDMHSYNYRRWDREVPVWNLGTSNIDNDRFGAVVEAWRQQLDGMELPIGGNVKAAINDTFQGNGYFLKFLTSRFDNTLVLATEISKIYCDELSGVIYPEVVAAVQMQLEEFIPLQLEIFRQG